jgi:hypothetical protein
VLRFDASLLLVVVFTFTLVPALSYITSRLSSLPVDLASAAISLIVFFGDSVNRFYHENGPEKTVDDHTVILMLVVFFSIMFAIVSIGIHVASRKEPGRGGSIGYGVSLFSSMLFLAYSILSNVAAPIVLNRANYPEGRIFGADQTIEELLGTLQGRFALRNIAVILGISYVVLLVLWLWRGQEHMQLPAVKGQP